MGATEDPELLKQTLDFITHKSKDQDLIYFFFGLTSNFKTRRLLAQYFKDEYDNVSQRGIKNLESEFNYAVLQLYKRFEGNFSFQFLVEVGGDFKAKQTDINIVNRCL